MKFKTHNQLVSNPHIGILKESWLLLNNATTMLPKKNILKETHPQPAISLDSLRKSESHSKHRKNWASTTFLCGNKDMSCCSAFWILSHCGKLYNAPIRSMSRRDAKVVGYQIPTFVLECLMVHYSGTASPSTAVQSQHERTEQQVKTYTSCSLLTGGASEVDHLHFRVLVVSLWVCFCFKPRPSLLHH